MIVCNVPSSQSITALHHATSRVHSLLAPLIWSTHNRERMLPRPVAVRVSQYLTDYAESKGIYMSINYVNADHVHALIDLPAIMSIKDVMQLLKGGSSHWINSEQLLRGRFSWGRGYAALSVSQSLHRSVAEYIAAQEEHHYRRTFAEEYEDFVRLYALTWRDDSEPTPG